VGAVEGCAELTEGLEAGGEARAAALEAIRGNVLRLALDVEGCRALQLALQVASIGTMAELLGELHGHVREALASPHANYVVQKVVEVAPAHLSSFVAAELRGAGAAVARHRYGCRVWVRLLEHSHANTALAGLLEEVLAEARELCKHMFAHYVLQSFLEHGSPELQERVAAVLLEDARGLARHRSASHVVEAALLHCQPETRQRLAGALLGGTVEETLELAQCQFGSFVVKLLLELPGEASREGWRRLRAAAGRLQETSAGLRLARGLGLGPAPAAAA